MCRVTQRATFMNPAERHQSAVPAWSSPQLLRTMGVSDRRLEKRWRAVALWKTGSYTSREICRQLGAGHDLVSRWVKRYEESGGVADRPRSGRPCALPEDAQVEICRALREVDSSSTVARRLSARGVRVTPRTVRNVAKARLLVYRVSKPKPALRRSHKLARLEVAQVPRPRRYWQSAMHSDEAGLGLYQTPEAGGLSKATQLPTDQPSVECGHPCVGCTPDLNIIENVWSMLGQALQKHDATTEAGLWRRGNQSL